MICHSKSWVGSVVNNFYLFIFINENLNLVSTSRVQSQNDRFNHSSVNNLTCTECSQQPKARAKENVRFTEAQK
jgi:hypothetical protein